MIYISFRYDDFGLADEFTDIELSFFHNIIVNEIQILINIVPGPTFISNRDKKLSLLKALIQIGAEAGIHGLFHDCAVIPGGEFKLIRQSYKYHIFKLVKRIFEDYNIGVDIYAAPWNQIDYNDIKILDELKFKIIAGGPDKKIINYFLSNNYNIRYLPFTTGIETILDVIELGESIMQDIAIICLLHPYEISKYGFRVNKIINTIKGKDNIKITNHKELAKIIKSESLKEFAKMQLLRKEALHIIKDNKIEYVSHMIFLNQIPYDLAIGYRKFQKACILPGKYYRLKKLVSSLHHRIKIIYHKENNW
jgi:hypothetical protein